MSGLNFRTRCPPAAGWVAGGTGGCGRTPGATGAPTPAAFAAGEAATGFVFFFISICLKDAWFFGAFTWFGGTSLLVNFVGGGTAAFSTGFAGLAAVAACLRAGADKLLASVPAACWFWLILSVTLACGFTSGALFTKLYFAVV